MPDHICILSSVHFTFDVRMFQAEARSLARAGFKVSVIALEDPTNDDSEGIEVFSMPLPKNRFRRMLATLRVLRLALDRKADLYSFHDPELIPACLLLKLFTGVPLIYDVHEDVPESIRSKTWIPAALRISVARMYRLLELFAIRFVDGLTLADHAYKRYYRGANKLVVLNYPLLTYADYYHSLVPEDGDGPVLVYAGSLTALRGLFDMLALVRDLRTTRPNICLDLVGPIGSARERDRALELVRHYGIESNVNFTGLVSHDEVHRHILEADVGLALLHADPNYLRSLPTKMFEYMMMGRAVVVSDFPLWKQILEEARCGIAVDSSSAADVVAAVEYLLAHPVERELMGKRGRELVLGKYNWECQSPDLVDFYKTILARSTSTCHNQ